MAVIKGMTFLMILHFIALGSVGTHSRFIERAIACQLVVNMRLRQFVKRSDFAILAKGTESDRSEIFPAIKSLLIHIMYMQFNI